MNRPSERIARPVKVTIRFCSAPGTGVRSSAEPAALLLRQQSAQFSRFRVTESFTGLAVGPGQRCMELFQILESFTELMKWHVRIPLEAGLIGLTSMDPKPAVAQALRAMP
jgi:hypothetical protein